jgi:hypothetical protein
LRETPTLDIPEVGVSSKDAKKRKPEGAKRGPNFHRPRALLMLEYARFKTSKQFPERYFHSDKRR